MDDSIPVSLFQSNLHQITLNQPYTNVSNLDNPVNLDNTLNSVNNTNTINLNNNVNVSEKKIFMVNKTRGEIDKDINMLDLEDLGLSEETKKLLGIN